MKIATLKIAFFLLAISFTNCSKDEAPIPPLQQLPPMTQVGANTVGCLVNGEVFLPHQKKLFGAPSYSCFHQFLEGNYEFGLGFSSNQGTHRQVIIGTNKLEFTEGQTYQLKAEQPENSVYAYISVEAGAKQGYRTTDKVTGELTITKLNPTQAIISGTFWFDAKRANTDEVIKIRDGRFDMQYSQ
ncbi:conserved exported hypothetical protein [Tenacibaculum sp. 190524A02b]|uniref:Lipoprotein n=1 Tax=Tenacibaculum vairaonense TaxID=3137860 RepID=A0ABM9PHQ3_9FLAO